MEKPQLYWTQRSPPARAVLITANLLGVELDLVETSILDGDHLKPEFLKVFRCTYDKSNVCVSYIF